MMWGRDPSQSSSHGAVLSRPAKFWSEDRRTLWVVVCLAFLFLVFVEVRLYFVVHESKPHLLTYCDLVIATSAGQLCFDQTDGRGNKVPLSARQLKALSERLKCIFDQPQPQVILPNRRVL
jgi:hypothetical protein